MRNEAPKSEHGVFSSGAARQALAAIRKNRGGAILVTTGHRDVRLVVEARRVGVEGAGVEFDGEEDAWEISRQFLNALFWGDATYFLDLQGKPNPNALSLRTEAVVDKAIDLLDEGFRELTDLRELVPGVDLLVSRKGDPPPADAHSCAALLFRSLTNAPRHLGSAAKDAGLDPLDAAWAVSDLLDAEAAQIKRPAPTMAVRRLKSSEALVREGLSPGVRALHLARGYTRSEPRRSAYFLQEAGLAFLASGQGSEALEMFKKSLEVAPKDLGGLEGMVRALEVVGQADEARRIREDLVDLYQSWNLPSRTLQHLDALAPLSVEQELTKLDCLLTRRDFKGAIEQAKRVFPRVGAAQRVNLARRFGRYGAPKDIQSAAIQLSGAERLLWPRRLLVLVCLALLVGIAGLGGEAYARMEYQRATSQTKLALTDLEPREAGAAPLSSSVDLRAPWARLEELRAQIGPLKEQLPAQSVLGSDFDELLQELDALEADALLLQEPKVRKALQWRSYDTLAQGEDALNALKTAAKSQALGRRVAHEQKLLEAYVAEVDQKIATLVNKSQAESRLKAGQELLRSYFNARARYASQTVTVELEVTPAERSRATWTLDGQKAEELKPSEPGKFEARLPLRPGARASIRVTCPDHAPWEREFQIETIKDPTIGLELIRCVPLGARVERLKVREKAGIYVYEEALDPKAFRTSVPEVKSSADLLRKRLETAVLPGERLVLQLYPRTRSGGGRGSMPNVYLSGVRVWLDKPGTKSEGRGHLVDLVQPLLPGWRRRVVRRSSSWEIEPVSALERFEELVVALRHAIARERESFK